MILNQSNRVNNINFPVWSKIIHEDREFYLNNGIIFKDEKFKFQFSEKSYAKRITQFYKAEIFKKGSNKTQIHQGKIKSCSIISAVIGVANYEESNNVRVLTYLIFPQKVKIIRVRIVNIYY